MLVQPPCIFWQLDFSPNAWVGKMDGFFMPHPWLNWRQPHSQLYVGFTSETQNVWTHFSASQFNIMDNTIQYLSEDCVYPRQHVQRRSHKRKVEVISKIFLLRKVDVPMVWWSTCSGSVNTKCCCPLGKRSRDDRKGIVLGWHWMQIRLVWICGASVLIILSIFLPLQWRKKSNFKLGIFFF